MDGGSNSGLILRIGSAMCCPNSVYAAPRKWLCGRAAAVWSHPLRSSKPPFPLPFPPLSPEPHTLDPEKLSTKTTMLHPETLASLSCA
eukprot:548784-Rhodomonas_salina.1